ncbi:MAG: hypothetical protein AAFX87_18350 [Bacteroidota bacterium]
MKNILTIILLTYSVSSFAGASTVSDTIPNWQVYNGGKILKAFNAIGKNNRIVLTKGEIRAIDTFNVRYFDDTPCFDCNASLILKTQDDIFIRTINNSSSNYDFNVKTTDLQALAFKNKSSVLRFYYKEDESNNEMLLFEIEIK